MIRLFFRKKKAKLYSEETMNHVQKGKVTEHDINENVQNYIENHCIRDLSERFARNGFPKMKDESKVIRCLVNGEAFDFSYETNELFHIEQYGIDFAVAGLKKERRVFINRSFDYTYEGYTSPYRTFYPGLMKEPFQLCFPFGEKVVIHSEKEELIEITVYEKKY